MSLCGVGQRSTAPKGPPCPAGVIYSTFPMKWNSIFVRRVKKTVFRFPFYRISILSRMKLQSLDFHFRPMSQFPSKCNTLAHENSAGEFPHWHSTPNFSLLQNVLSKQNELSKTCLSSCFVSTTPHKQQFTG